MFCKGRSICVVLPVANTFVFRGHLIHGERKVITSLWIGWQLDCCSAVYTTKTATTVNGLYHMEAQMTVRWSYHTTANSESALNAYNDSHARNESHTVKYLPRMDSSTKGCISAKNFWTFTNNSQVEFSETHLDQSLVNKEFSSHDWYAANIKLLKSNRICETIHEW